MKNQILGRFLFILVLGFVAFVYTMPPKYWEPVFGKTSSFIEHLRAHKVNLGLDLAGGTELDYQIDLTDARTRNNDEDPHNNVVINDIAESVRDALERRVNPAGVGEITLKRSRIEGEEHILIQMPPSTDIAKAKAQAEQDNRLEFFAEKPELLAVKRVEIAELITIDITPENWEEKSALYTQDPSVQKETFKEVSESNINDEKLLESLEETNKGDIVQKIIDTNISPRYEIDENGQINVVGSLQARDVLAIVRVVDKTKIDKEKTTPPEASARHILIPYPGATRVPEDIPYQTKEAAQAKAQEIFEQVQDGGDFEALAKEFSTDTTSSEKGGDLGSFNPGTMIGPFNDAVFALEEPQLIDQVIETDFGFHIIEVTQIAPEKTETVKENQYSYEFIAWDKDEIIWEKTELGGKQLDIAQVGYNQANQPLVDLRFDNQGAEIFGQLTETLSKKDCGNESNACRLGIKVGSEWASRPTVREKINSRQAQITGLYSFEEAKLLSDRLNLGAIDAPVTLSGQTTVEASLGASQLDQSIKAAFFGLLATIVFMICFYNIAGIIASISLLIYAFVFVMLLKIWPDSMGGPIVLTLSGAAGIALSLGLAVDGNILIFERIKEEIKKGRPALQAVDLGFERAWNAIRDSNLTTLLSCIILFSLGSSIIKGFAIVLILGTLLSMFTAIIVSRNLLRAVLLIPKVKTPLFMPFQKNKK